MRLKSRISENGPRRSKRAAPNAQSIDELDGMRQRAWSAPSLLLDESDRVIYGVYETRSKYPAL
jgi:hypothetical protein